MDVEFVSHFSDWYVYWINFYLVGWFGNLKEKKKKGDLILFIVDPLYEHKTINRTGHLEWTLVSRRCCSVHTTVRTKRTYVRRVLSQSLNQQYP